MENKYQTTLKLDTFIQGTLILFIGGAGILSIFGSEYAMLTGALLLFPLGVWQVSSALLFSILLKDGKKRGLYLLSVVGFFTAMYLPQVFNIKFLGSPGLLLALPVMAVLALHYFSITMKDMVMATSDYIKRDV